MATSAATATARSTRCRIALRNQRDQARNGRISDSTGNTQVPENIQTLGAPNLSYSQRLRLEYHNSTNVPPHHLVWNGIYELPLGRGKRFGKGISKGIVTFIMLPPGTFIV